MNRRRSEKRESESSLIRTCLYNKTKGSLLICKTKRDMKNMKKAASFTYTLCKTLFKEIHSSPPQSLCEKLINKKWKVEFKHTFSLA